MKYLVGKIAVKCCRKSDKPDKESILKEALATAKLWEARYTAVDHSRQQYRDQAIRLVGENETLQSAINKTEKDTIEVKFEQCTCSFSFLL